MSYTALQSRKEHDKPSCIKMVRDYCVEEYQAVDYFFHNMWRYFELHLRFMLNNEALKRKLLARTSLNMMVYYTCLYFIIDVQGSFSA